MTNLLAETLAELKYYGLTPQDVDWVGTADTVYGGWEDFALIADTEYDSGYGSQKVAADLMIVGDGWWMTRFEYDGLENWVFHRFPEKPANRATLRVLTVEQHNELFGCDCLGWVYLEELHDHNI